MDRIYHLLMQIKKDPTAYLGKKASLELLCAFTLGYEYRATEGGLPIEFSCLDGFQIYVANFYGMRTTTRGWPSIIQFFPIPWRKPFQTFTAY